MTKIIFHILNIIFIILYIYPGSLLGFLIYKDISKQPQISPDFIVSSNHVYAFLFLSFLGLISYLNETSFTKVLIFLIALSLFSELSHLVIPNRSFQYLDIFGNLFGTLAAIGIIFVYRKFKYGKI